MTTQPLLPLTPAMAAENEQLEQAPGQTTALKIPCTTLQDFVRTLHATHGCTVPAGTTTERRKGT